MVGVDADRRPVRGGGAHRLAEMLGNVWAPRTPGPHGLSVALLTRHPHSRGQAPHIHVEKLITQDGVVGVGGGYHSSVGVASKDIADAP